MTLEREVATYRQRRPELLAHKGEYVVIYGEEVVGIFSSLREALKAGYEKTLTDPFLVRQIKEKEEVVHLSRYVACPTPHDTSSPKTEH